MDADTIKLVLTRLHDDCKAILIGFHSPCDNVKSDSNTDFDKYIDHMTSQSWAKRCVLKKNYRGELSTWADNFQIN